MSAVAWVVVVSPSPAAYAAGTPVEGPSASAAAGAIDVTPPRLSGLSLGSHTVTAGGTIVMRYTASDVGSGVASVRVEYEALDPHSARRLVVASPPYPGYAAAGLASGAVPRQFPGGHVLVVGVTVTDNAGNSTVYDTGGVHTLPSGLEVPPAIDLAPLELDVWPLLLNADRTAPLLTSLSIDTPDDRRPGESVDLTLRAADEGESPAGVAAVKIVIRDPLGRTYAVTACGSVSPGHARLSLPRDAPSGRWAVAQVQVSDFGGNYRDYGPDGVGVTVDGDPDVGPSFADLGFTVSAGTARPQEPGYPPCTLTGPSITMLSASASLVRAGSSVTLSGRVSWGAGQLLAVFARTGVTVRLAALSTASQEGDFSIVVPVPATSSFQVWALPDGSPPDHESSLSVPVAVTAGRTARVVVRDTSVRVPRGAKRALSAYVSPRRAGVPVTLWRKVGSTWKKVAVDRSGAKGKVSYRVSRPKKAMSYRWTSPYLGGYLPATSTIVVVRR